MSTMTAFHEVIGAALAYSQAYGHPIRQQTASIWDVTPVPLALRLWSTPGQNLALLRCRP
jgi:hypothetical protein